MQWLFCTNDAWLMARWRQSNVKAAECAPEKLPKCLLNDSLKACVLDADALGEQTLKAVLQSYPQQHFLVTVSRPDPQQAIALFALGARGYANRQLQPALLEIALQTLASGELWVGAETLTYLLQQQAKPIIDEAFSLSEREQQVAQAVAQGLSNKQIATSLDITERTVKAHLKACFQKTGCANRVQLALKLGQGPSGHRQVV